MVRKFVDEVLPTILVQPLLDPRIEQIIVPSVECDPLPYLKVYSGFGCAYCSLVSQCTVRLKQHYNSEHAAVRRGRGGLKSAGSRAIRERLEEEHFGGLPPWHPVKFQRFFSKGKGSTAFRVRWNSEMQLAADTGREVCQRSGSFVYSPSIREEVFENLAQLQHGKAQSAFVIRDAPTQSQASPWLERTRWSHYLHGVDLNETARLIRLPDQDETVLSELSLSVDRLIDDSYKSVCEDKINFFAQKCFSSLLPRRKAYSQPLIQKQTYQRYKELWKRLICFACRTTEPNQSKRLRHRLTGRQMVLIDEFLAAGAERAAVHSLKERDHLGTCTPQRVDDLCLDFCIALLDHPLKGDIYESVVLGFLAVLGIDTGNSAFHQTPNYTPKLLGFIKIGQMLVLQKAVRKVEKGEADNSLDPLNDMRQQFMTVDNCTPFSWAVSLRSFGKSIRDCVTSLGYIQWSEDGLTVFYRNLELQLSAFRTFVAAQVQHAQGLLADLFLISPAELREDVIPAISLYRIRIL